MRRTALAITAAAILVAAPEAHATGGTGGVTSGGTSDGTAGVVYHSATVGGVTFTGSCQYAVNRALPDYLQLAIGAEGTASGAVAATIVECHVLRGSYSTWVWQGSPGFAHAFANVQGTYGESVTGICVTVRALRIDGVEVSSGEHCVVNAAS